MVFVNLMHKLYMMVNLFYSILFMCPGKKRSLIVTNTINYISLHLPFLHIIIPQSLMKARSPPHSVVTGAEQDRQLMTLAFDNLWFLYAV